MTKRKRLDAVESRVRNLEQEVEGLVSRVPARKEAGCPLSVELHELGLDKDEHEYLKRKGIITLLDANQYFLSDRNVPSGRGERKVYSELHDRLKDAYERACRLELWSLSLPGSASRVFERLNVRVLGDLTVITSDALASTKYCGIVTETAVEDALKRHGLSMISSGPYDPRAAEKKLQRSIDVLDIPAVLKGGLRKDGYVTCGDLVSNKDAVRSLVGEQSGRAFDVAMARQGLDYLWSD